MPVTYIASSQLPTCFGQFTMHAFEDMETGNEHLALCMGEPGGDAPVLARIHSECLTGDALFSLRCDCGAQLKTAMKHIADEGRGIILYLRQEGRGIGLVNKVKAYHLQDKGADTVEANEQLGFSPDLRTYEMCSVMFAHLRIKRLRLMTNNPRKIHALYAEGIEVVERISLATIENPHNENYLATKMNKLGHMLETAKSQIA